jgi:hypothetical protein
MDEARQGEIAGGEPPGDLVHVTADLGSPFAVRRVALQGNPAAVGQRLEDVTRGVLVHAHGDATARLYAGERGIPGFPGHRRRIGPAGRQGPRQVHD